MHPYDRLVSAPTEDIEFSLNGHPDIPWAAFLLNPRRLRDSDFLMRWSQGVWSEKRIMQGIAETGQYFALAYGPSGTAPSHDVRAFELYFERLERAGLGELKRPDLLIFRKDDRPAIEATVKEMGGAQELPFISENAPPIQELLDRAILAIECENSLWRAGQMPDYGAELRPMRRLGGLPGLPASAVLPTVILKEEDRPPLHRWQQSARIPIHIWHVFYDMAFGLSLDTAETLIQEGRIQPTEQTFQAPGGATTRKTIFKVYYHYAYPLGKAETEPNLVADHITDNNGHILPYVRFEGGQLTISADALDVLKQASARKS